VDLFNNEGSSSQYWLLDNASLAATHQFMTCRHGSNLWWSERPQGRVTNQGFVSVLLQEDRKGHPIVNRCAAPGTRFARVIFRLRSFLLDHPDPSVVVYRSQWEM
jgi:hypothetical protein